MIKELHTNYTISKTDIYVNRAVSYIKSTLLLQSFCLGCLYISYINFDALATVGDVSFNLHLVLGLYFSSRSVFSGSYRFESSKLVILYDPFRWNAIRNANALQIANHQPAYAGRSP